MGKIRPEENWATECPKLVPTLFDRTKFTANSPRNAQVEATSSLLRVRREHGGSGARDDSE